MEKLLEQISAYEILNNLLPGTLFCALLKWHTGFQPESNNAVAEIFIFYFVGLVVSRFGSLVIEPLYKKLKIIKTADYTSFIIASAKDSKIDTLSTKNNMYRTFVAVFFLYAIFLAAEWLVIKCPVLQPWLTGLGVILILLLFSFSYRKQTDYIRNRISIHTKDDEKEKVGVGK